MIKRVSHPSLLACVGHSSGIMGEGWGPDRVCAKRHGDGRSVPHPSR